IVIHAPFVPQFALCIENERVWCCFGAILISHFLCLAIIEIGKVEMAVRRANLHLGKGIADVCVAELIQTNGVRIIGLNGYKGYAAVTVVRRNLLNAWLVQLSCWT